MLALRGRELSVSIVGDDEMRALNRHYRRRDRPTDVLAFALDDDAPGTRRPPAAVRAAGRASAGGRGAGDGRAVVRDAGDGRALMRDAGDSPAASLLGDVVISIDTAEAQARERRRTVAVTLDELLVHGVLHLIGYDHEISPAEARRMFRKAREVERALHDRGDRGPRVVKRSR